MKKILPATILFLFPIIFPIITGLVAPAISLLPAIQAPPSNTQELTSAIEIKCLDTNSGTISEIDLEEYLVGVLAAEMPAEYHPEALKAQAVAARSYILSRTETENDLHPDADICTDSTHCKDWLSKSEAMEKWEKKDRNSNWEKLKTAVLATCGEYMIYGDEVVEACFFASSGGRTENSEDVWGGSRPYLKSVESSGDIENPKAKSTVTVSYSQLASALGVNLPSGTVPQFANITRTEGGSVATADICGKTFKGTEIRNALGLKSANFTVATGGGNVTFSVLGYGHGVGMSQTGANHMANSGKNYTEILSHYYTNIQIAKM